MDRPVSADGQPVDEQNLVTPITGGDEPQGHASEGQEPEGIEPKGGSESSRGRLKVMLGVLALLAVGFYFTDDGGGGPRKKKNKGPNVAMAQSKTVPGLEVDTEGADSQVPAITDDELAHDSGVEPTLMPDRSAAIPASLLLAEVTLAVPLGLFLWEIDADLTTGVQITGMVSAGQRLESLARLTEYIDALRALPFLGEITENVIYVDESEDLDFTLRAGWRVLP